MIGHHPPRSNGHHGNTVELLDSLELIMQVNAGTLTLGHNLAHLHCIMPAYGCGRYICQASTLLSQAPLWQMQKPADDVRVTRLELMCLLCFCHACCKRHLDDQQGFGNTGGWGASVLCRA